MNENSAIPMAERAEDRARNGFLAALLAYTLWGFTPIYFVIIAAVPPLEVLAHRVVWAVPFGALIVHMRRQWPEVRRALGDRRTVASLGLAAVFIAINWLGYIIAVQTGNIFQASLGYYINPLLYVAIGVWFFHERLRRLQTIAVLLAAAGVTVLTVSGGEFPLLALILATSFTIYGVIRSRVEVGGMPGLFVETVVLLPLALGYVAWITAAGAAVFGPGDPVMSGLLVLAGPLTALPLLFFALAARRLRLSTIGIMQFIAPTLQFLMGLLFGERLTVPHAICFLLIWLAVLVFSADAWRATRKTPIAAV
ncbi:MAG TPA: EamA family transporter RarD [Woeseiaceae bacterium]|nr:EamA family transporter RarD [Woeseiaceae bacterium]